MKSTRFFPPCINNPECGEYTDALAFFPRLFFFFLQHSVRSPVLCHSDSRWGCAPELMFQGANTCTSYSSIKLKLKALLSLQTVSVQVSEQKKKNLHLNPDDCVERMSIEQWAQMCDFHLHLCCKSSFIRAYVKKPADTMCPQVLSGF